MGNSVLLCLLLAFHIRSTGKNKKKPLTMVFEKVFISYLVILFATCMALPTPQEVPEVPEVTEVIEVTNTNEAEEILFELARDHDLETSINGGQSGGWQNLFIVVKPSEVFGSASARPKRHEMPSELVAPKEAEDAEEVAEDAEEAEDAEGALAPIAPSYGDRLSGAASLIALANKLSGAKRTKIERVPGYGRKKRQVNVPDAIILHQVLQDRVEVSEANRDMQPQIKSWGKSGLLKSLKSESITTDSLNLVEVEAVPLMQPEIQSRGKSGLINSLKPESIII